MTYVVHPVRIEPGDNLRDTLDDATLDLRATLDVDAANQLRAAVDAILTLLESGELGDAPWSVSITGHSNPGHVDRQGWASDSLIVMASRIPTVVGPGLVAECASCGKQSKAGDPSCCSAPRTTTRSESAGF